MKKQMLVAVMVLFAQGALAQEFTPYLGVNLGHHSISSQGAESAKNGYSVGGKVLGSWEFENVFLDAGLGYTVMELTSSRVKITTRFGSGDLEARYKLSSNWSLGPAVRVQSGTDNTNSEVEGASTVTTSLLAKLTYQTKLGSNPARFELGAGSTLGEARNMTTVMVGVQIGFPWAKEKPRSAPVVARAQAPAPKVVREEVADLKVDLKMARVRFDTDKFEIGPRDEAKLAKLAKFLRETNSQWGRIKISGHTDQTGDPVHNKQLSQDRADSVMKVFLKNGVQETKMSAHGYGSAVPVDATQNSDAWMKNRRTEIEFFGVKNRADFNAKLIEALK